MTTTFTLKRVQEVADIRTDTAAANLGTLMQHLQRQEAKLALLLQYREEYQERLRRAKQRGRDEWRTLDQRSRAYDTLSQRFDTTARRQAETAEQKQQDAHAARLTSSKI